MDGANKRFRFDRVPDIAIVNAIMLADAHVAKTGDVKEKFSGPFNMFCASHAVTSKLEKGVPKPKLTTIQGNFHKMVKNRRT